MNGQGQGPQDGFIPMPVNLSAIEAAPDFVLYPTGEYLLKITAVEVNQPDDPSKAVRLSVRSEIQMGPGPQCSEHNGKTCFDNFNLDTKGFPFLKKFLLALGITDQHLANWEQQGAGIPTNQLVGAQYVAMASHREYNGNKYNNWGRYALVSLFGQPKDQQNQASMPQQAAPQPGMLAPQSAAPPPQQQVPPTQFQQPPMQQGQFPQGVQQPPMQQFQQPQQPMQAPQLPQQQPAQHPAAPPPPGQIPGQGQ